MHSGDPLERQKQDSHDYRKTGALPLIFFKNHRRHYTNDRVKETVKKVGKILDMRCEDEYNN